MKLETLLPLGKVDPGLRTPETPLDIHAVARDVQLIEALGYDGFVVEETKDDPFVVLAIAVDPVAGRYSLNSCFRICYEAGRRRRSGRDDQICTIGGAKSRPAPA